MCVGVGLPEGVYLHVVMMVVSPTNSEGGGEPLPRKAMHVQSHSEWAPANIGPYSQAYSVSAGDRQE